MNPEPPFASRPKPLPKKRSWNWMMIIAIVVCCMFFACAGCCFLSALLLRTLANETPTGAAEAAAAITDWKVPEGFSGRIGMTVNNSLFRFNISRYDQDENRGLIVLSQRSFHLVPDLMVDTKWQEFIERTFPELKKLDLSDPEIRNATVRGTPAEFQISRGEDPATTTRYRQVIGYFQGKSDRAVLILQCEEKFLTDAQIDQLIDSIK